MFAPDENDYNLRIDMSIAMLKPDPDLDVVPPRFADHQEAYRLGLRAGRNLEGGYRLNMEAMRYEPAITLADPELEAWTEGFRAGYLARRAAGEPLRY